MTASAQAMAALRRAGAVLEGHFQYASGRHGGTYIEKFRLLEDPAATGALCAQIAERFRGERVTVVVGPTTGGVLVAYETARQLGARVFIAEAAGSGERRSLRRGFAFHPGQRALIVDDVLTTGGSVAATLSAVRAAGGAPIGVAVLVDRSGGRTAFPSGESGEGAPLPFFACLALDIESFTADACPYCRADVPLTIT